MIVLAIDQGTSGTKAIVVDEQGAVLALANEKVHPVYLVGGGVEQDPRELLASVVTAGRRAVAEAGVRVDAVALANQGETVLAWDPTTGEPLSVAIVWQDRRAESVCAELAQDAALIASRTGLVLDPYFSAPKMTWLRRHLTTDGVVTTTDAWLLHHLTGEFVTDVTTASRSLVLDVDSVDWDEELLDLFGLGDERLPRLVACDEIVGTTSVFGAEATVAGLIVDQQAALLAERCLAPGSAKCTFGTGAFLLANTGEIAVRSAHGLTTSVAWRTRQGTTYCLDGQVYTAASAVRWMRDLGLVAGSREMDDAAGDDCAGVLFVPALAGLAAPWWRPDALASLTGLSLATDRGHIVRAVIEGVAAQVADLALVFGTDMGTALRELRVDGGLTRSTVLMQATADLLQVPVEVFPSAHATPLGAAALARLAMDPALTIADVMWPWTPSRVYEPRWTADRATDHLARWRSAAAATLPSRTTA
ncbi:MAG: carbohydrate kinase [Actinobacteria bacterium]|nr:carbohydrate kinase [Actinomycetota bacterium]